MGWPKPISRKSPPRWPWAVPHTFDCGCTESSFAYVYPSQPYVVHLCRAFWPAPALGTDSKAGTLVHEASHFTVLGGTKDYAYGQASAQALAKSDPGRAVMNADSHEYFAENHPRFPSPEPIALSR